MMWQATLRDLQWRRRRFMIAITGTALVFAMSLLMSGLAASFTLETDRTLKHDRCRRLDRASGGVGPVHALALIPDTTSEQVAAAPGVTKAESIIYLHQTIGEKPKDINLFGVVSGGFAEPTVTKGRQLAELRRGARRHRARRVDRRPHHDERRGLRDRRDHEARRL